MSNQNAFCSDYSYVTSCLLAIQTAAKNGEYNDFPIVIERIKLLDQDVLRKLYLRTITVLGILNGEEGFPQVQITGDYTELDFEELDFWIGFSTANISGDFFEQNFLELDFWTGFIDNGYADDVAVFQTILNIFKEFCTRSTELSDYEKALVDASLVSFLDAFNALKALLEQLGINTCGSSGLNVFNNSPNVFLQVAGSDGTNGIAAGFHLRWSFAGELAENHLPKGNYFGNANNHNGFNQPNDFIHISRTPYQELAIVELDLQQSRPVVNSQQQYWTYSINQVVNDTVVSNQVRVYFANTTKYYNLALTINPNNNSFGFLNAYDDVIEISVLNKTFFHFDLQFSRETSVLPSNVKIEATSVANNTTQLIKQTTVMNANNATSNIVGDNLNVVRYKKPIAVSLNKISFETYHDFQLTRSLVNWSTVGTGFAISLNEAEVRTRLESPAYPIDNLWPQYNGGTKVRASNYIDKWFADSEVLMDQSIQQLLALYLQKSENDSRALYEIYPDEDPSQESQKISLLDVIQLQALDYHLARMIGLGHIDTPGNVGSQQKFVYKLSYQNKKSKNSSERITYTYLSLPTSKQDTLSPALPEMRPVSYRLSDDEDLTFMFDDQGYTKRENSRLVNIGRQLFYDERRDFNFFDTLEEIVNENFFQHPKPLYYGLEYRAEGQTSYLKPEITSTDADVMGKVYYAYDNDFPVQGIPELNPLADDTTSLFVHFEKHTGVHYYALYGINWFSRASAISNEVATTETIFQSSNLLFSPTDVGVQYIQKEEELVFTTTQEQTWLRQRMLQFPGEDTALTRVTFNWVDTLDVSGLAEINEDTLSSLIRANRAKAFFKPRLQKEVTGVITDMRPVDGNDGQLMLFVGAYQLITLGQEQIPSIATADLGRFDGGNLSTPEAQFKVLNVVNGSNGLPIITIEKSFVRDRTNDREDERLFGSYKSYTIPSLGTRFSMVENLSNEENWDPLAEKIELISFADTITPVIETDTGESGDGKYWIGGVTGPALIKPVPNDDDIFDGYYEISFETAALDPHPQINIPFDSANPTKNAPGQLHKSHIEWYKGIVRLPVIDSDEKKLLQVVVLEQTHPLKLYVYDSSFDSQPVQISTDEQDWIGVNYHPGYKAYFFAEPAPAYSFNANNIMPVADENDKRNLLAVQTLSTESPGYVSGISIPAVLLARNIYEPVQPEIPIAPGLKVRPDATKQAAFTFDVRTPNFRKPFGFMFYRTSHMNVLTALYAPQTITNIISQLETLSYDPHLNQRYLDLVNLNFEDENQLMFEVYEAEPSPYGFPSPDKAGLFASNDTIQQKLVKLETAILGTLLPLTEQPPILKYLKTGTQTTNDLAVIRDVNGNLLDPNDSHFNPFPMVRTYTKPDDFSASYVRITDYFLNAFSRDFYFYTSAEINNQLSIGPISNFLGPVQVLYTETASVPIINNFALQASFSLVNSPTVAFEVSALPEIERFEKLRLFRTTNERPAVSVLQMDQVLDVEIDPGTTGSYTFEDDFSDLPSIPFGQTLYYRIVALRTIINEFEQPEEVLSQPSEMMSVRLIDTQSPAAPELNYDEPTNTLSWMPTAYNGVYHLFKQNNKANWEKIHDIQPPNSNQPMSYGLPEPLPIIDEDGNKLYHRFKVQLENSSGRINIIDNELTLNL